MKKLSFLIFVFSLFIVTQTAHAAAKVWEIDKAHTGFYFSVDHIFSKVQGYFGDFSGEVVFDPDNLAESKFVFTIDVKSIHTGIAQRDKHLVSADFFDEAKYPTLNFVSKTITKTGDNTYDVAGKFTAKGKEYDLVLPLVFEGVKEHPMSKGKDVAGFNGTITIDRLAFGIGSGKFYELGVVGKDVGILVTIEALSK